MLSRNDAATRREALQELMGSEGWAILLQHVAEECLTDGYRSRMALAFEKGGIEPLVWHRVSQEIVRMLRWPESQIDGTEGESA